MLIDTSEEDQAEGHTDHLRNRERPPHRIHIARKAQKVGCRQQRHHLTHTAGDGGIYAIAQSLEACAQRNADGSQREMEADDPQSSLTDGQEIRRGLKHAQQNIRHQLEHRKAQKHTAHSSAHRQLQGVSNALFLPGAVVEGHDGNGGIVQAEQRHEEEALQLEVDAKHTHRCHLHSLEGVENSGHAQVHHGANSHHNDGGNAHRQNGTQRFALRLAVFKTQGNIGVLGKIEINTQAGSAELTNDRGHRCAGNAHFGEKAPTKNEAGVQNHIHDGAGALGDHGVNRSAGGLQQPLAEDGNEHAQGADAANGGVDGATFDNQRIVGHHFVIASGAKNTKEHKDHSDHAGEENAIAGSPVGLLTIALTQGFAQQRIDADANAGGKTDLQILHGERQAHGRHQLIGFFCLGVDAGHKETIHHIVQRLNQHT